MSAAVSARISGRLRRASPWLLAGLLAITGTLHLTRPEPFDALIPPFLPHPRMWTYGSGLAELAVAAAVALPRSRRLGGLAAAALFVAVFPGNVYMAFQPGGVPRWLALLRLPLQLPLVLWALQVRRDGLRPSRGRGRS